MSTTATVILIVVLLLVLAALVVGVQAARRRRLRKTFGPEYDRVVADTGNRADAEKELLERTKRHARLELKPLTAENRARYSASKAVRASGSRAWRTGRAPVPEIQRNTASGPVSTCR